MINSPIRYFGGKGGMIKTLWQYVPKQYSLFVEPFCGSAVMSLNAASPIIINDLDLNVYNFFSVLRDPAKYDELRRMVILTPYGEPERAEAKAVLKTDETDPVRRAWAFFVANRLSHSGQGGLGIATVKRRGTTKSVSDFIHSHEMLELCHKILENAIVLNRDALRVITDYDMPGTFLYLDPPYHHDTRTSTRYNVDMTDAQHQQLIDILLNLKHAKALVSGYDHPLYDRLVDNGWYRHQFVVKTVTGTLKSKEKTETVWLNYDHKADEVKLL